MIEKSLFKAFHYIIDIQYTKVCVWSEYYRTYFSSKNTYILQKQIAN